MKKYILIVLLLSTFSTYSQLNSEEIKKNQNALIEDFLNNCAKNYDYSYQMNEWQNCLDIALKKDSTIAYLWQQKAMPYFKVRKYEVGMKYLDKAVKYNREEWQPYRAFIKCIFAKTYKESIIDFEDCKKRFGNRYVMDHTYDFYIGLCYLQLNEYQKAEKKFKEYIDDIFINRDGLEHPTAFFYYGIAKYEQKKWEEAIIELDKALRIYSNFSDAKFYKSICLFLTRTLREEAKKLVNEAKEDAKKGYTINEDNTIYETYPYQIKWKN